MYPSYRPREVLEEYAIVFFTMLNEGYRQQAQHYLMVANIVRIPSSTPESTEKFLRELEWAATDTDDILKPVGKGSSPAEIKKVLGG